MTVGCVPHILAIHLTFDPLMSKKMGQCCPVMLQRVRMMTAAVEARMALLIDKIRELDNGSRHGAQDEPPERPVDTEQG